jgi:chitinase
MTRLRGQTDSHGSYLYVDYAIAGQDVAGNYTDVSWTTGVHWGSSYFNIHDAQVFMGNNYGAVGGTTQTGIYNSGWPISGAGTNRDKPFWSATTRCYHNSNGDGNITFNGSAWWDEPSHFTSHISVAVGLPHISRISNPPSTPTLSVVTSTSVNVAFTDGGGGAPIDGRDIGYSTSSSVIANVVSSDGNDTISGLTPGTTYYFWARTHNVAGYSGWSGWASALTLDVPGAPVLPTTSELTQVSVKAAFDPTVDGGSPIIIYQLGYGTNSSSPTSIITASPSGTTITGLLPGTKYYIWARGQNSVGYGPWSPEAVVTTIAGAWVKSGGIYKPAIPYVKDGGVWKLVRPWVRTAGVWKETS